MTSSASSSGASPALVLAPGMLSDEGVWAPQVAAFGDRMDVSVANYGQARTLTEMAQALLDQAPARFALAAHSLGGRVAMEAARLAPERLTGLCLISADTLPKPGGEAGQAETRARYGMIAVAREQGMPVLAERFVPAILHKDRLSEEALVGPVRTMLLRQDPDGLERQIEAGEGRPDHAQVLRDLKVPALLICGVQDSFGRGPLQADMALLLGGAPVLLIERCGHLPTLEEPDAVNQAMEGWLADAASGALRPRAAIC